MIGVKLEGRLGNQLFQYAFAYASAKKLNAKFYLDTSSDNFLVPKYFEIKPGLLQNLDRIFFSIKGFKHLFSFHLKKYFYTAIKRILLQDEVVLESDCPPRSELKKVRNNVFFRGYFQSEDYFREYSKDIRDHLRIRQTYTQEFEKIVNLLPAYKHYVVIHVRRGDYVDFNLTRELEYYYRAIAKIDSPENFYIVVSDDPGFVTQKFKYLRNVYISREKEIIDFQFLMKADICILSNSSFSWWGAYLNKKTEKIVIAPANWCGKRDIEFPLGISNHLKWQWI